MKKKKFLMFFQGGMILLMLTMIVSACDKKDDFDDEEPNTNPKNIVGRWQQYEVAAEDNTYGPGNLDEYWIFKSDGSFQEEEKGVMISVGTFQINDNILSISSHSVSDPDKLVNYSGEFYFSHGHMFYDYYNLETGKESRVLFKKM